MVNLVKFAPIHLFDVGKRIP